MKTCNIYQPKIRDNITLSLTLYRKERICIIQVHSYEPTQIRETRSWGEGAAQDGQVSPM